jgi:hypothetical protein
VADTFGRKLAGCPHNPFPSIFEVLWCSSCCTCIRQFSGGRLPSKGAVVCCPSPTPCPAWMALESGWDFPEGTSGSAPVRGGLSTATAMTMSWRVCCGCCGPTATGPQSPATWAAP